MNELSWAAIFAVSVPENHATGGVADPVEERLEERLEELHQAVSL